MLAPLHRRRPAMSCLLIDPSLSRSTQILSDPSLQLCVMPFTTCTAKRSYSSRLPSRARSGNTYYRGPSLGEQLDTAQAFPSLMSSNTGRVEMNRRWPRDEVKVITPDRACNVCDDVGVPCFRPKNAAEQPRRPEMSLLKSMRLCAYFWFQCCPRRAFGNGNFTIEPGVPGRVPM
jgi:hypothetical protein